MNARTAVFILGMHRSGTSALTRVLSLLGAALPHRLHPPGIGNETGHWEPKESIRLNDRVLEAAGTSVGDLYGPSEAWFRTEAARSFVPQMRELIDAEFGDAPLFVFKDPRSALVFPLWRQALAEMDIRCVVAGISRNPIEVAQSLSERQGQTAPGHWWPMERAGLLWLRYTLAAERYSRGVPRSFCLYASLLNDWRAVATQLSRDLDVSWPRRLAEAAGDVKGFLSAKLRHHHANDQLDARSEIWRSWIAPVFNALRRTAPGSQPDPAVLDAVGRSFQRICNAVRPGVLPDEPRNRAPTALSRKASHDRPAGRKRLCLVVTPFLLADERVGDVRAIVEGAVAAGFSLTIVTAGAFTDSDNAALSNLAEQDDVSVQPCAASSTEIEPAYLRPTVELFRHLRAQSFDAILFPDHEGLGYGSIIAKRTGLAFAETMLAVLAFGGVRFQRERSQQFPGSLVPIASEYVEQKAVEAGDIAILPQHHVASWMHEAGWRLGARLTLPEAANGSSPKRDAWAEVLRQLPPADNLPMEMCDSKTKPTAITIVIPTFDQPQLLDQNLDALSKQSDRDFSVVVVDDGSRTAEAQDHLAGIKERYPALDIRLVRQENRYLGAARNAGMRAATTDYVILLDDDNVAYPDMVRTLRRAVQLTGAHVITCGISIFHDAVGRPHQDMDRSGPDEFFPGGPVLLGAVHNCFGDASAIYRKSALEQVGGFHELHGVTFEDWQVHLKIAAAGYRLISLPEPLVWYRVRHDSMLRTTRHYDNARVIASTVRDLPPAMLEPLSDYLMGSEAEQVRLNGEVRLIQAVAAVNSIILLEASTQAARHAEGLQEILDERNASAAKAEEYVRSLERALEELRRSNETATRYAASLERSRAESEAYAKLLEQTHRKARDGQ